MKLKTTLLASAALLGAFGATSMAQDATFDANDVILGFRAASSTTGAGTTLMINLGAASTFRDTTGDIMNIVNVASLLNSTYGIGAGDGSQWYERTNLWAGFISATNGTNIDNSGGVPIASQTSDPNSTIYVSTRRTALGTVGSAQSSRPGNTIALDAVASGNDVTALGGTFSLKDGSGDDSNATAGIVQIPSGTANSWNTYTTASNSIDFSTFNVEAAFTSGVRFASFGAVSNVEQAWDFYRVANFPNTDTDSGKGIFQGAFVIAQDGNVSFVAVPEPSVYALLALGVGLVLFTIRRRSRLNNTSAQH